MANYTFIDSLFGGHLLSSIFCEQCKTCSQNIEPFLDLSLPIVDDKTVAQQQSLNRISARSSSTDDLNVKDNNGGSTVTKNQLKKQRQLNRKPKVSQLEKIILNYSTN